MPDDKKRKKKKRNKREKKKSISGLRHSCMEHEAIHDMYNTVKYIQQVQGTDVHVYIGSADAGCVCTWSAWQAWQVWPGAWRQSSTGCSMYVSLFLDWVRRRFCWRWAETVAGVSLKQSKVQPQQIRQQ